MGRISHATRIQVLLADGPLINANANENPDLYRALKGGGSNFGTFFLWLPAREAGR